MSIEYFIDGVKVTHGNWKENGGADWEQRDNKNDPHYQFRGVWHKYSKIETRECCFCEEAETSQQFVSWGTEGQVGHRLDATCKFNLMAVRNRLRKELKAYQDAAPFCDKHTPKIAGEPRSGCMECALQTSTDSLARIDFICGNPSSLLAHTFEVYTNQQAIVDRVSAMKSDLIKERKSAESLAIEILGKERYDNSPCQAHPLELLHQAFMELEANRVKMEEELSLYKLALPVCAEHKPNGGVRSTCMICAIRDQSAALSRIDYLCGEPNEMETSGYDVHYNEQAVVESVTKLRKERDDALKDAKYAWQNNRIIDGARATAEVESRQWKERHDEAARDRDNEIKRVAHYMELAGRLELDLKKQDDDEDKLIVARQMVRRAINALDRREIPHDLERDWRWIDEGIPSHVRVIHDAIKGSEDHA